MGTKRTHILLPHEIMNEIDQLVGRRGRSRFLVLAAEKELKRVRLLKAIEDAGGSWEDDKHPELKQGARIWVRKLRKEDSKRGGSVRN